MPEYLLEGIAPFPWSFRRFCILSTIGNPLFEESRGESSHNLVKVSFLSKKKKSFH